MRSRLIVLVVLLLGSLPSFACMCFWQGPKSATTVRQIAEWDVEQNRTGLVFEGVVLEQQVVPGSAGAPSGVLSMTPAGARRVVKLRVVRMYSGTQRETVEITTGLGGGDCGFDFANGKAYLVFASPQGFTSSCTPTDRVENAGPWLRVLQGRPAEAEDNLSREAFWRASLQRSTATVCGHVFKQDGTPFGEASVDLWQDRPDGLPTQTYSDPNLSKKDGSFCIPGVEPGTYLLSAEKTDYDANTRLAGFYPGVRKRSEAKPIVVTLGPAVPHLEFKVLLEPLHTVSLRVINVSARTLPIDNLAVTIDSPERDPLSYHQNHLVENDGSYTFGYVPEGPYIVRALLWPNYNAPGPDYGTAALADVYDWSTAETKTIVSTEGQVVVVFLRTKAK